MEKLKVFAILFAWCVIIILIFWIANSCGIQHHYNRMEHHENKLLEKGEQLEKDTIVKRYYDTLVETVTKNDTTYVYKTVTKTIQLEPEIIVKDRWRVKTEYKYKYKEKKEETKQAKEETKQTRIEAKANKPSKWWLWIIIGLAIGYVLQPILTIFGAFKNLPLNK